MWARGPPRTRDGDGPARGAGRRRYGAGDPTVRAPDRASKPPIKEQAGDPAARGARRTAYYWGDPPRRGLAEAREFRRQEWGRRRGAQQWYVYRRNCE